ncbi:acyl-CoA N-acyltransferase [Chytriomyces sp. MP71]|nr:acyl-CoA N-acyltransferase [Chytriomyces sp. MP71]
MLTNRLAIVADVPALLPLINEAYRGDGGWTSEAELLKGPRIDRAELIDVISGAPETQVILAFVDAAAALAACVRLERISETEVRLGLLAVDPSKQGTGIGKIVLKTAEEWAVENWGSQSAVMSAIHTRTELLAYYERRGYKNSGEMQPFPYEELKAKGREKPTSDDFCFAKLRKSLV